MTSRDSMMSYSWRHVTVFKVVAFGN